MRLKKLIAVSTFGLGVVAALVAWTLFSFPLPARATTPNVPNRSTGSGRRRKVADRRGRAYLRGAARWAALVLGTGWEVAGPSTGASSKRLLSPAGEHDREGRHREPEDSTGQAVTKLRR